MILSLRQQPKFCQTKVYHLDGDTVTSLTMEREQQNGTIRPDAAARSGSGRCQLRSFGGQAVAAMRRSVVLTS